MSVYWVVPVRNLLQARRRTSLIALALALVTALLVLLMSLSQGLSDSLVRSASLLMAGHVNVAGFYKSKPTDAFPVVNDIDRMRDIVRNNTPGLDFLVDRSRGWAKIVSESDSLQVAPSGIDIREEGPLLRQLSLAKESAYKQGGVDRVTGNLDDLTDPFSLLIFAGQAERLGVTVGDAVTMVSETMNGTTNTIELRIAAVAQDVGIMSNWNAYAPKAAIRKLYNLTEQTSGNIMIFLKDIERAEETMEHLRTVFENEGFSLLEHQPMPFFTKFETVAGEDWTGQRLDLTTWTDELGALQWTLDALEWISFVLIAILTVIIGVGIMNTMWMAVRERTREIGTIRAIGMTRSRVLSLFLVEAFLLGLAASILGALLGSLLAWTLHAAELRIPIDAVRAILMSDTLRLIVVPDEVIKAIAIFTLLTGLASLWPALKASRMQPVTAIHHAG